MTFAERVAADVVALSEWRVLIMKVAEGLGVSEDVALRYYTLARIDLCVIQLHRLSAGGDTEGWKQ